MRNFGRKPPKILFIRCCDKRCQWLVVLFGIKSLPPHDLRALTMCLKFQGENKVMPIEVFNFKELILD